MRRPMGSRNGQAIIMVTLMLLVMGGILGLAVDLGWSFFVKKSAQAAADAAALAAVLEGQSRVTLVPPFTCGNSATTLNCTNAPVDCASIGNTSNLYNACQYATQHGFTSGGRTTVTVDADVVANRTPPTVSGVTVFYWVTVRVHERIPQLFSAIMGNTEGGAASRATAALANVVFEASLQLINRQNDPNPDNGVGVNFNQQGGGNIQAPGGMILASNIPGAAVQGGSSSVTNTPFSYFRGAGTCTTVGAGNQPCNWTNPWSNGKADGPAFWDPTRGKDQPPLENSQGTARPVEGRLGANNPPGTTGSGTQADPYLLPPGQYYSVTCSGGNCVPTGQQIVFDNQKYYKFGGAAFGQYVFYGGLATGGGNTTITFSPGRYVFAGTTNNNPSFAVDNGTTINDTYNGSGTYPGEIFIFTNANYSAHSTSLEPPVPFADYGITFNYGEAGFKSGNSSNSSFVLRGIDKAAGSLPAELQQYAPFLFWQDRGNSYVQYEVGTGNILTTGCLVGNEVTGSPGSMDNPCKLTPQYPEAPRFNLQATPSTNLSGALYTPRGAWVRMSGGSNIAGPLKLITGAINTQGGPTVILTGTGNPITIVTTALIE